MRSDRTANSASQPVAAFSFAQPTFAALLFLALFAAILPHAPADAAEFISGSGCSVSNMGYLTDLAAEYERRSGIKVLVRGGGSAVGIEDLRSGTVDFAASCRARAASDPADIRFVQVAWDALVPIVHPSNPVDSVTTENIRDIYGLRITNWSQLKGGNAPLKVFVSRAKKGLSGVEASMRTLILNGKHPVKGPNVLMLASTAIVEQMVEDTPGGFAITGFSSAQRRSVKLLSVNGVRPTIRNILKGTYPFRRPLFILHHKDPKPEVRQFIEYILSANGQRFIKSRNVVSLQDVE